MTKVHHTDTVVYEVALNSHPLVVGEDDERGDEELIEAVEGRTETADDIDWPDWTVFTSDPPDDETLRYVNTTSRINVRAPRDMEAHKTDRDVFDEVTDRVEIEGFGSRHMSMSYWPVTHEDDFDGEIHLDLGE